MSPGHRGRIAAGLAATLVAAAGCAPALRPLPPPSSAGGPSDPEREAAEVHALARRAEGAAPDRAALAEAAVAAGQRCEAAAPGRAACDYALAIALGLQARERPATAHDGLPKMVALLRRAAAAEPGLDRGGPERVLALLLVRAPGWPLGPGDAEEGLAAARRAATRAPEHAPNLLALAEALRASGDEAGARAAAERALALAAAAAEAGDPEAPAWSGQAIALLRAAPAPGP